MKQPLWILNSSLLVLFLLSQSLLFMLQRPVLRRLSITPDTIEVTQEQVVVPVNIKNIYEHDLFGTYQPPVLSTKTVIEDTIAPIPLPPKLIVPDVPVEKTPTFFAPLDVVLKGVIFVKDNPASCIAIVQLKKTKEDRNYQVGDFVEDAQILKILSNRIILIRANGQQETLYLREEDAVSDFNTEMRAEPKLVVEDVTDNKYIVNIDEFIKRVHNLGEFINLLDLTTVYKQGKSFGCRVGKIDKDSLGTMLGFVFDDIIVKIDEYDVDDLAHRLQVYDNIMLKRAGDIIEVTVYRGNDVVILRYALVDNLMKSVALTPLQLRQKLMQELSSQQATSYNEQEKSVVIQRVQQDDEQISLPISDSVAVTNFPENSVNCNNDDISSNFATDNIEFALDKKIIDRIEKDTMLQTIRPLNSQTLNEADMHKKRLMLEQEKISSTIKNMRSKDKDNMIRRTSKNIILNGMQ